MIESELETTLARPPNGGCAKCHGSKAVPGYRHGHRSRSLIGTFGQVEIAVPGARLDGAEGKTTEWKSSALRAYQRRTKQADSLIAGAYLCRDQYASCATGTLGCLWLRGQTVSRVWRKV